MLTIHLFNPTIRITQKQLTQLDEIPFRQETVYKNSRIRIINDSTSTSPNELIAAIDRFKGPQTIFIAGGTRKDVSFDKAARSVKKHIHPKNLIVLSGSATDDLLTSLQKINYPNESITIFDTLQECIDEALARNPKILVFSPGAASFEKFNNEFDRGEQFTTLIKKALQ